MKRSLVGWIVAVVLATGGAAFAYVFWFAGGSGEPSTDLTTPELSKTTTAIPTGSSTMGSSSETTEGSSTSSFEIDQAQSTARFEIDEVLNGNPTHVVGTTDQVVGQIRVDANDLSSIEFSEIIVNARTLSTGSQRRDRAMRGPIVLDSGSEENDLITLVVTSVEGLSGEAEVGESFEFTVTGDLTIKGNTESVSFDVTVTLVDDDTVAGSATANVARDMFEIGIPSVASVADVTNEILIGLDFVAVAG